MQNASQIANLSPIKEHVIFLMHHMVATVHTMPINLSFIDFLHIPEQMCVRDLRERIAAGGDPTKLHESPVDNNGQTFEQGI